MESQYETDLFILVFKTDIQHREDIQKLKPLLDTKIGASRWSVDLSDVDFVLRVESQRNENQTIIEMIKQAGYHCEELID
jgi:hypothetical protein